MHQIGPLIFRSSGNKHLDSAPLQTKCNSASHSTGAVDYRALDVCHLGFLQRGQSANPIRVVTGRSTRLYHYGIACTNSGNVIVHAVE